MRPRWHDWVIALSILAIAVTGVAAIWGDELGRLFGDEKKVEHKVEGTTVPTAPGSAAGPF